MIRSSHVTTNNTQQHQRHITGRPNKPTSDRQIINFETISLIYETLFLHKVYTIYILENMHEEPTMT